MKKDKWDYQNRYEDDGQYEHSEYIFVNPDRSSGWSLRNSDEDDEDAEWQDAVYEEDDE